MEYKRVLLKLSGEAIKNKKDGIVDFDYVLKLCKSIASIKDRKTSVAIVVGGGNIWRGRQNSYIDSSSSDKIGILGTSINALILKSAFDKLGIKSCLFNSFEAKNIMEKTPNDEELIKLSRNNIIIFGGGTGNVGCSTDTASILNAIKLKSDLIVKLTNVDGIYNKDPHIYNDALKYNEITFEEAINKNLNVMDINSIKLSRENNIKILVTNINSLFDIYKMISTKAYSIIK